MAKVDPAVGAKIFLPEEVESVSDGETTYLRVIPNRKRAMPILVPVPESLMRAQEATRLLLRKSAQNQDLIALSRDQENRIQQQKALIEEKDRVIADQVTSIQSQHEAIVELGNVVAKNRETARSLALRMTALREAVLALLRADEDAGPWKLIHRELRIQLTMAGYRLREEMPWWSPVRWFGGGNALPLAFFLPVEELNDGDVSVRQGVAKALLQKFRILLSEPLGKSSLSVEETGLLLNVEQDSA